MKSKKMYRIELFENNAILQEISLMACLSNGGKYLSLTDLESVTKANYVRYSGMSEGITISLIGNTLLVDKGTVNQLKIEEVEIMEIEQPEITTQEAKDLLSELTGVPTLDRQSGIANTDYKENLN